MPFSGVLGIIQPGAFELGKTGAGTPGFRATANPQAAFLEFGGTFTAPAEPQFSLSFNAYFVGTSDPRASFTQGLIIFTASPLASFAPINNAYTQMGFTGTAYPLLTFTPDATGIAIAA